MKAKVIAIFILIITSVSVLVLFYLVRWTLIVYLSICFIFGCVTLHKKIIKNPRFEWYRWLVNSLIYRYHVYVLKRQIRKLSYTEKIHYHSNRLLQRNDYPRWFDKYWFGRGSFNVMVNEMIKAHNENGVRNLTK